MLTRTPADQMSEVLFSQMVLAFRPILIKPHTPREEIMYSSGQQAVVQWLAKATGRALPVQPKVVGVWARIKKAVQLLRCGYAD